MNAKESLIEKFHLNRGFLHARELNSAAMRYHLAKMVKEGTVNRIFQGMYVLNNHEQYDERVMLSELVPEGVFCLFSTWDFYGLTTTVPAKHHLALNRKTRISTNESSNLQIHYWSEKFYQLGKTAVILAGKIIPMYDIERSVCDAVRFKNKVGDEMTIEVLRTYLKSKNRNLDKLMKYASELKVQAHISPYIKSMI
ncbi:MAG: hypothetical protein KKA07_07800 [Bacteroidetes bacterium]|nr:hypothetical protein [Bacteroidota bacterium]MBU1718966.1 hypothetical protein [Bacteroidota bacterium]